MKIMPKTTYSFCLSLLLCGLSGNGLAAETTRVSVASDGTQGNSSRFAFLSLDYGLSADGRYVAFHSDANNLVAGDGNRVGDIFVHDRQTRQTTRVSVASSGLEADSDSYHPSLSADGRYVALPPKPAIWSPVIAITLRISSSMIARPAKPHGSMSVSTSLREIGTAIIPV